MGRLRIEVLRSIEEVSVWRAQMDALNLASRRPCPFSTFEYISAFVAHDEYTDPQRKMLFLAALDEGRLVAYLPLCKEPVFHWSVSFQRVGVLVSHDTDRPHVVAKPDDEARCGEAFYRHLLERERGVALFELAMQDAASALTAPPPLPSWRFMVRRFENMPNTTIPLAWASFAEYFSALPKAHRRNVARLGRRLLGAGKVEMLSCTDPRGRRPLLELYLDLERRSWKERAHAGIGRAARRVAFFQSLCGAAQPLELGFDLLCLDDLPIAGMVSGSFASTMYGLEMAFDQDYDDLAPGHLMTLLAIRRALAAHATALNFNGNYSYYKARLGGVVTPTSAVQLFRVGTIPWIRAIAGQVRRRLVPEPPADATFNPDRRRVVAADVSNDTEGSPTQRPPRDASRARTAATLRDLENQHVEIERLAGDRLADALPFLAPRAAA